MAEARKHLLVGITGGIGSGKSMVAGFFRELGACTIDSDQIARRVVVPEKPAWQELVQEFGRQILNDDSTINRERVSEIVFKDNQSRLRLIEITHPRIREETLKAATKYFHQGAGVVMIEAALFGESPYDPELDALILVSVDPALQLERVLSQGKLTREQAVLRIASQRPQEDKKGRASFIIDNSGSLEQTRRQLEGIWQELVNRLAKR